jgi:hypothetical protein
MKTKSVNVLTGALALTILLMLSLGCSRLGQLAKKSSNNGSNAPASSQKTGAQSKSGLDQKTQLYISKCFNPYSNSVMSSYQRYASWIKDIDAGPTGKEQIIYGLYQIHGDGEDCATAITEANSIEPRVEAIERAADDYSKALRSAIEKVNEVYSYYDQEDYKDDHFQKAKESHAGLIKAFREFETADKTFGSGLDELESKVSQDRLDQIRDDPSKNFEYTTIDFEMKSKKVVSYAQHTKYADMTADDLQKLVEDLEPALNAMKNAGKGKTFASTYFNSADELLKDTKALMRRIKEHAPFNQIEKQELGTSAGWMIDGSPDQVIYTYNQMIGFKSLLNIGR